MLKKLKITVILVILLGLIAASFAYSLPKVDSLPELVKSNVSSHDVAYVSLTQVPTVLQEAIIDTEDQSFYTNSGISIKGIGRSIIIDLISRKYEQGASTITQQLVREYYLSQQKTAARKLKEIYLAQKVTKIFSKSDILEMYLNSVYLGHGAWGVNSAAKIYFNKSVSELNSAQCTLLAGLPQAPSYLDPYKNLQGARDRQLLVLHSMVDTGDLNQNDVNKILAEPLDL